MQFLRILFDKVATQPLYELIHSSLIFYYWPATYNELMLIFLCRAFIAMSIQPCWAGRMCIRLRVCSSNICVTYLNHCFPMKSTIRWLSVLHLKTSLLLCLFFVIFITSRLFFTSSSPLLTSSSWLSFASIAHEIILLQTLFGLFSWWLQMEMSSGKSSSGSFRLAIIRFSKQLCQSSEKWRYTSRFVGEYFPQLW